MWNRGYYNICNLYFCLTLKALKPCFHLAVTIIACERELMFPQGSDESVSSHCATIKIITATVALVCSYSCFMFMCGWMLHVLSSKYWSSAHPNISYILMSPDGGSLADALSCPHFMALQIRSSATFPQSASLCIDQRYCISLAAGNIPNPFPQACRGEPDGCCGRRGVAVVEVWLHPPPLPRHELHTYAGPWHCSLYT